MFSRLITDNIGGYLWLTSKPTSRFEGWFLRFHKKIYKIVDNLEVDGGDQLWEKYSLSQRRKVLFYELDRPKFVKVDLDIRQSYSNPGKEVSYKIEQEGNNIIVYYLKEQVGSSDKLASTSSVISEFTPKLNKVDGSGLSVSDQRERSSVSNQCSLCVVFKCQPEPFFIKLDRWISKKHPFDKKRSSPPTESFIYRGFKVKTQRMVIGVGKNKREALSEINKARPEKSLLLKGDKIEDNLGTNHNSPGGLEEVVKNSYECALDSLSSLLVFEENRDLDPRGSDDFLSLSSDVSDFPGIYAGLPWFFQFWSRDELISTKALSSVRPEDTFNILSTYLNFIREDGRIANVRLGSQGEIGSADSIGWLWLRIGEFLSPRFPNFPSFADYPIGSQLEKSIEGLLKNHTSREGLAVCRPKETWMDSIDRSGARIEIQALRLNMYKLAYEVGYKKRYKKREKKLRQKVRKFFWNDSCLRDGKEDSTIRPNVFLAYYIYPQLLSEDEWRECFDTALKHLWCDWQVEPDNTDIHGNDNADPPKYPRIEISEFTPWPVGRAELNKVDGSGSSVSEQSERSSALPRTQRGTGVSNQCPLGGLATINKNDNRFCDVHTGQNPKSYHNGDSWFWVNNIAALSMFRVDPEYYKKYIKKIILASCLDILGGQVPGHASELSSASSFSPAGSPVQAWSAATFIELINALNS